MKPTIPVSVPSVVAATATTDLGATVLPASGGALDTNPDARQTLPGSAEKPAEAASGVAGTVDEAKKAVAGLPSNYDGKGKPVKKKKEKAPKKVTVKTDSGAKVEVKPPAAVK